MSDIIVEIPPNQNIVELLQASERASQAGNQQDAYDLSLQATRLEPENCDAWLARLALAPSLEERVVCLSHLNELAPDHHDRHNVGHFTLRELVDQNPFLAYLEETDDLYRVLNADRMLISIRKKRAPVSTAYSELSGSLKSAYGWLMLTAVGLLLAGFGTWLFAPLAVLAVFQAAPNLRSRTDRVHALVVLGLATLMFIVGAGFTYLLILHWIG